MSDLAKFSDILGLSATETPCYECLDTNDTLKLFHYRDETETVPKSQWHIRGTIVDTVEHAVVSTSFGYTPTVVLNKAPDTPYETLTVTDHDAVTHTIDLKTAIFQPCFEGVLLRFFLHNGVVQTVTHRRFNADKSRWGSSEPFLDLYKKYGGPEPSTLFDMTKRYSTCTHVFLVTDVALLIASKIPILTDEEGKGGFVTYLGPIEHTIPYSDDQVDTSPTSGSWFTDRQIVTGTVELGSNPIVVYTPETRGRVQLPTSFDWEMAQQVLFKGYYPSLKVDDVPELLRPGESVICKYVTVDGKKQMVKLCSASYKQRLEVIGNESNHLYQAYKLMDYVHFPREGDDRHLEFFPPLACLTDQQFQEAQTTTAIIPLPGWIPPTPEQLVDRSRSDSRDLRLRHVMTWIAFASPPSLQGKAFSFYKELTESRLRAVEFIADNQGPILADVMASRFPKDAKVWTRIKTIITVANDSTRKSNRHYEKPAVLTKRNIYGLLMKEVGISLYRICRAIRNFQRPPPPAVISVEPEVKSTSVWKTLPKAKK